MSAYSTYDIDGYPTIPNQDNYVSPDLKYLGLSVQKEAMSELSNLAFNDSSVNIDLVKQDIYTYLYEKEHVNCLGSCTKDPCSYFNR